MRRPSELDARLLRDRAAGETIISQARTRVSSAILIVLAQIAFHVLRHSPEVLGALLCTGAAYAALVGLVYAAVRRTRHASPALVTILLAGDLAFAIGFTTLGTPPADYERALFGAMVVIHVANFSFGPTQAWRTMALSFVAYLSLILVARWNGVALDLGEELWTLLLGAVGTMVVLSQTGDVRRRLQTIVALFERAEEGDFTRAYDEASDHRFDAITRVGRAYNRVRAQLANMVLTDPLTSCLNRRGFEQAHAREISRARRSKRELSLLLIDLDHFKQVNDTHGHPAGDAVLRATGRMLIDAGRAGDIVARVGGEEFAILLPDTGLDGAIMFASRLCDTMRAHEFEVVPYAPPLTVTTSIGIATFDPRNGSREDARLLGARADAALYQAKHSGRDRACTWSADLDMTYMGSGAADGDTFHVQWHAS